MAAEKNLRLLVVPFVEDALGFGGIVRTFELVDRVQHGLAVIGTFQRNRRDGALAQ